MVLLRQKSGGGENGKGLGNDRTKENGKIDKLVYTRGSEGKNLEFLRKR